METSEPTASFALLGVLLETGFRAFVIVILDHQPSVIFAKLSLPLLGIEMFCL